jgi:osomolarity two-component system response regulator SKN7
MPKLDGVSATSLIRKFDPRTPIISMTSNSKPHDIMYYFSQGMNDILPKPFTKEGLLDMLEKHLFHLKVADAIRNHVPRGVGIPPLNDENFNQALMVASQSYNGHGPTLAVQPNGENAEQEEGKGNPFAGMGLSDEHYAMILQNFVNNGGTDGTGSGDPISSSGHPIPIFGFGISSQPLSLGEKRPLDDPQDREDNKRSRFQVIE